MTNLDLYERLSFLFGTDKQLRIRRFMVLCREKMMQRFSVMENVQLVLSGSISDGVGYPSSDDDTMFVILTPDLMVRYSLEEAVQYSAPLMIPSDESPGYCLLWYPNKRSHRLRHACFDGYLSSLAWKKSFKIPGFDLHGPCMSGFIGDEEYDYAYTLKLNFWPD